MSSFIHWISCVFFYILATFLFYVQSDDSFDIYGNLVRRRFSDTSKNKIDFVNRKHSLLFFMLSALSLVGIVFLLFMYFVYSVSNFFLIMGIVCLVFSSLFIIRERHWETVVNACDFQSTIFANALAIETEFCFIVNNDGKLIYSDRRFQERFKFYEDLEDLLSVLKVGNLKEDEILRFCSALKRRDSVKTNFSTKDGFSNINLSLVLNPMNGELGSIFNSKLKLSLNPLARPRNYFVIKATKIQKEEVYEDLISEHSVGMFVSNLDGYIVSANKAFINMMEVSEWKNNYFIIKDFLISTENKGGAIFKTEKGINIPVKLTTSKFVDRNNNLSFFSFVSINEFDSSDYHQHPCFLEASIPITQHDGDGNIVRFNKFFQKIFNWNPQNISELINVSSEEKKFYHFLQSNVLQNSSIEIGIPRINKEFKVYVNKFITNGSYFSICYFIDITENKDLKIELEHSQKMQSIGQLAGGIAHDFNNILTAILGHCDLILSDISANDRVFNDVQQIRVNSNRAANLVNQLLAFSRKQILKLDVVDIVKIIEGLSSMLRRIIGENIYYDFLPCGEDSSFVNADTGQLEQVVINLVINACHAMSSGGRLLIKVCNKIIDSLNEFGANVFFPDSDIVENGEYVVVEIIDEGGGIPLDIINKIFNPFFSTKELGAGTGLGLSMVYGIVKQSGGYIFVESTSGVGSKFSILLPRVIENIITKEEKEEQVDFNQLNAIESASILLVEDEGAVRSFAKRALIKAGHKVIEAICGEDAINVVKTTEEHFDIIISDIVMPGMSGLQVVSEVRKILPNIKVIFVSGYAEETFAKHDGYSQSVTVNLLHKPFSMKMLVNSVQKLIT